MTFPKYCILSNKRIKNKHSRRLYIPSPAFVMSLLLVSGVWLENVKLKNGIRFIAILPVTASAWIVVL